MNFVINTTPEKYFYQLIEILKVFAPFNVLRKRQRQVFAELLYYNYKFSSKDKDQEVVDRLVFDFKTRQEISDSLNISKANLYNIYKELRQAGLLSKDKDEINPKFRYSYLHYPEVKFIFKPVKNKEA